MNCVLFFFVLYITKYNTNYKCLARIIWINNRRLTHCLIIKINWQLVLNRQLVLLLLLMLLLMLLPHPTMVKHLLRL